MLANIYLHELDSWWWEKYGKLSTSQKTARRRKGQGNVVLIRYADDFILLTNGTRQTALRLRDEVRDFLAERLYLELSLSKTHVTHVQDGFDFLGYHLHYRTGPTGRYRGGKPALLVTPSRKSVNRFRDKVRAILHYKKRTDDPVAKMRALDQVTRGWGNYYRHVNAKRTLSQLDHWTFKAMLAWLAAHHGRGVRWAWRQYVHPQGERKNLAVRRREGTLLFRHVMADTPQCPYFTDWTRQNLYLTAHQSPATLPEQDVPLTGLEWEGVTSKRMALTYEARQRDRYSCQRCGSQASLEVHHRKGYRPQDKPNLDDLVTLCRQCHLEAHA